ncbi:L-threonylcarbamoyladenylate synthase [Streptococcus dentapri]|uniref:L-threonylcarbamoyladenylate synthase n=1 Tax=Streptococcus dentapri TaxID=573564 RepID=A0ABV8CZQ1_9STRE
MDEIVQKLTSAQPVILPTETVYGLFAPAFDEKAVNRVYELKQRPRDKAMNLNVASYKDILKFSKAQPIFLKSLCEAFLPGPLTIILKANDKVPSWINSGLDTVGFRLPKHPVTQHLIKEYGPLIGPSANLSGKASGSKFDELVVDFAGQVAGVKDDEAITGQDSTILDLSDTRAKILRQGAITKEDLLTRVPELDFY